MLKSAFQRRNSNFIFTLNNTKRHLEKEMHEIHGGSDFRLHDGPDIKLPSVGQRLMFVFGWYIF